MISATRVTQWLVSIALCTIPATQVSAIADDREIAVAQVAYFNGNPMTPILEVFAHFSNESFVGLAAAFHEANRHHEADNTTLLGAFDRRANAAVGMYPAVAHRSLRLHGQSHDFRFDYDFADVFRDVVTEVDPQAFALTSPLAEYSASELVRGGMNPNTAVVGSLIGTWSTFQETARPPPDDMMQVMHLRQPLELGPSVHFAAMSNFRCKRLVLVQYALSDTILQFFAHAVAKVELPAPLIVNMSYFSVNPTTIAKAVKTAMEDPRGIPHAILMPLETSTVASLILAFRAHPLYHEDLIFVASSVASPLKYADATGSAAPFGQLFLVQGFPHPEDGRFSISRSYKAALARLNADAGVTPNPADIEATYLYTHPVFAPDSAAVRGSGVPTYPGIEGYVVGRLMVEGWRRSPTPTGAGLTDAIYATRLFPLDDYVAGPFARDNCAGGRTAAAGPCICNTGARGFFMTRVNATTGRTERYVEVPGERGVAEFSVPPSQCLANADPLLPPRVVVIAHDAGDAAQAAEAEALRQAIEGLVTPTVTASLRSAILPTVVPIATSGPAIPGAGGADAAAAVLDRYAMTVFAGTAASRLRRTAARAAFAGGQAPVEVAPEPTDSFAPDPAKPTERLPMYFPDRDRGWAAASEEAAAGVDVSIPFYPTLADFSFAAAKMIADGKRRGAPVCLFADSASLLANAVAAANTFRLVIGATTVAPDATAGGAIAPLTPAPCARGGTAVVVSRSAALVTAAVRSAVALPGVTVVLAADELVVDSVVRGPAGLAATESPSNLLFVSGLRTYAPPAGGGAVLGARAAYRSAIGAAVVALHSTGAEPTPAALAAEIFDRLHSFTAGSAQLGPFSRRPCAAVDTAALDTPMWPHPCADAAMEVADVQCAKGIQTFYIRELRLGAFAGSGLVVASHKHSACGPSYVPLPDTMLSAQTIALIAGGSVVFVVLTAALVAALLIMWCRAGNARDNRHAPKDPTKPFAIVFTDIQASTTLWARCPQEMGPALDDHHAIMRRLVVKHAGYEVKTIGDSFMVAFGTARAAVEFALGVQESFFKHDFETHLFDDTYTELITTAYPDMTHESAGDPSCWKGLRVRVGVHFGAGEIKKDPVSMGFDYYGTVVNTAARVEGVAHGGQVLITEAAYQAAINDGMGLEQRDAQMGKDGTLRIAGLDDIGSSGGATAVSLGQQALRGLDEAVSLVMIAPHALVGRCLPPLRLDVEIEVPGDETDDDDTPGVLEGGASANAGVRRSVSLFAATTGSRISDTSSNQVAGAALERLAAEFVHLHCSKLSHELATAAESTPPVMGSSALPAAGTRETQSPGDPGDGPGATTDSIHLQVTPVHGASIACASANRSVRTDKDGSQRPGRNGSWQDTIATSLVLTVQSSLRTLLAPQKAGQRKSAVKGFAASWRINADELPRSHRLRNLREAVGVEDYVLMEIAAKVLGAAQVKGEVPCSGLVSVVTTGLRKSTR